MLIFDLTMLFAYFFDQARSFSTVVAKKNSDQVQAAIFQERTVPRDTRLAGWAALVETFHLQVPVRHPTAVSEQHIKGSRRAEG